MGTIKPISSVVSFYIEKQRKDGRFYGLPNNKIQILKVFICRFSVLCKTRDSKCNLCWLRGFTFVGLYLLFSDMTTLTLTNFISEL